MAIYTTNTRISTIFLLQLRANRYISCLYIYICFYINIILHVITPDKKSFLEPPVSETESTKQKPPELKRKILTSTCYKKKKLRQ